MKRFIIGVITGILFAGFVGFIIVLSLLRLGQRKPAVEEGSTLILRLTGEIPEKPPTEIPIPFVEAQTPPTVAEIWSGLRRAAADSRIKAVVIEPGSLVVGWATLEELHSDLVEFRK